MKKVLVFIIFLLLSSSSVEAFSGKVGAYFFYWFQCPGRVVFNTGSVGDTGCDPSMMPNRPVGAITPYPEGGFYNLSNVNMYKREFKDMVSAGITDVFPVSYQAGAMAPMVQALREGNYPLKFGFFWGPQGNVPNGIFDFTNQEHRRLMYTETIQPYFRALPREYWSVTGEDKRPLIFLTYRELDREINVGWGIGTLLQNFKDWFWQDFGVSPFLVVEQWWFEYPTVSDWADAKYSWISTLKFKTDSHKGYTITGLTPGSKTYLNFYPPEKFFVDRENGNLFKRNLSMVPSNTDLLMIESWNELFEGTSISRMVDYYDSNQRPVEDIYYMKILQEFLGKPGIPKLTVLPPSPNITVASCSGTVCTFSWESLASRYGDNVRYLYKIFGSTISGDEKFCPLYTFDNDNNTSHGGGCWRGNTSDNIPLQDIVGSASYANSCPGGECTLSVWVRDGSGNVSLLSSRKFNTTGINLNVFKYLNKGWNFVTNTAANQYRGWCVGSWKSSNWWKAGDSSNSKRFYKCGSVYNF